MAHSTTQHRPSTEGSPERDASAQKPGSRTRGLVSMAAGALGVVAATLPSVGLVALLLAAVALGVGVPVMRRGPGSASFPFARVGVVLGMIAVLIGFLSIGMELLG